MLGDAVTDAMAWVQAQATPNASTNEVSARLDAFRAGTWELHASLFLQQLERLKEGVLTNAIAKIEQSALDKAPRLKGGLAEKLLHQFLGGFGRLLVERKVTSELKGWGADRIYLAVRNKLTAEAAKAGVSETITRSELSRFIVREGIVPGIMGPIRSLARGQQWPLIIIAGAIMILPPLCLRLKKNRFNRTAKDSLPGIPNEQKNSTHD